MAFYLKLSDEIQLNLARGVLLLIQFLNNHWLLSNYYYILWVFSSMVERVAVNHQTKVQFLYYPFCGGCSLIVERCPFKSMVVGASPTFLTEVVLQ